MSYVIIHDAIKESIEVKEKLLYNPRYVDQIEGMFNIIHAVLKEGNKIMFAGNGGSAADAQHLAAEFVVRYKANSKRPSFPALSLSSDASVVTAGGNDFGYENVFSQQVEALGKKGDILVVISTSGGSKNLIRAAEVAKEKEMIVLGLLGGTGGLLAFDCNSAIIVPSLVTARIQEAHIMIGHIWCEMLEYQYAEG